MREFGLVLIASVAVVMYLTGLPAYIVLLMAAIVGAIAGLIDGGITINLLAALPGRLFSLLEHDLLQALPLYLLMGALLNRLPVAEALFRTAGALFRKTPAAPSMAGLVLGGLLGPMNGSVGASVLALSNTVGPRLRASGVSPASTQTIVALASTLGVVVPPSLVLILLGDAMLNAHTIAITATGRADRVMNTQDLLRGALIPAALFFAGALAVTWMIGRRVEARHDEAMPRPARSDVVIALVAIVFLAVLLGGVTIGKFFAVEAAATGAMILFVVALITGKLHQSELSKMLANVLASTGTLFAPLLAATSFTLVLRLLETDRLIDSWVAALPGGQALAVLVILSALAVTAFALDAFEIIFVAVPILMPPLLMRAPDAVWIGVLALLVLQASFLLPPIGYALLLTRGVTSEPVPTRALLRSLAPYLLLQALMIGVVFAWPQIVHLLDPPQSTSRSSASTLSNDEVENRIRALPSTGLPPLLPSFPPPPPAVGR